MSEPEVTLHAASLEDKQAIAGLFQFYAYDFSDWEPATSDRLDFEANGLFADDDMLDSYWTEAGREPLLIRVGGKLAGFVLLNQHSHCGAAIDFDIGEFFVARKFRRGGTGSKVLEMLVQGRPGRWEAAIAPQNLPAQSFWPKAIAALPGVRDITTTHDPEAAWKGPILHFTVG